MTVDSASQAAATRFGPGRHTAGPGAHLAATCFSKGVAAEDAACRALENDGWRIHGKRWRTEAGEIDAVAEKDGVLAFVEVKARRNLRDAAEAVRPRQQARLMAAAEIVLGMNPGWGVRGVRFDVIAVDSQGRVRRVKDAFRQH